MSLEIMPITLEEANMYVELFHRHHKPVPGHKFSIGLFDPETMAIHGVAIIGRPVARMLQDGWTMEVTRVATDGTKNACSKLYGAAWRAAKALGYKRIGTYTLPEEGGASLRAAGWKCLGECGGGKWNRKKRPRIDSHPTQSKIRWEMTATTIPPRPPCDHLTGPPTQEETMTSNRLKVIKGREVPARVIVQR